MNPNIAKAFTTGYERMAGWSELLDEINVYPVADADTGRNLRISLSPLSDITEIEQIPQRLLAGAVGNSGNIAAAFFSGFILYEKTRSLPHAAAVGAQAAWKAIAQPVTGTMLCVFDVLAQSVAGHDACLNGEDYIPVIHALKAAVIDTASGLERLRKAGVVDAGALGMYLFFEGFFSKLMNRKETLLPVPALFGKKVARPAPVLESITESFCISTLVTPSQGIEMAKSQLGQLGSQVIMVPDSGKLKAHFHSADPEAALMAVHAIGRPEIWKVETIAPIEDWENPNRKVHVAVDAAGSICPDAARKEGLTLLDSYIVWPDRSVPETSVTGDDLYAAMRKAVRISTAQASSFERDQRFESLLSRFDHTLYLSVGSVYTGNFQHARTWVNNRGAGNRFKVVDTGAASGRLAVLAIAVSRFAKTGADLQTVEKVAQELLPRCEEFIFLDQLKYLATGGRISKAGGFFGDMLRIKPVITPTPHGARKAGAVKSRAGQVAFALDRLKETLPSDGTGFILLEHSDNADWVASVVAPEVRSLLPQMEILGQPLSLTSGVHMGPGTWGVAFIRPQTLGTIRS